jgi:hypothetical protein
MKFDYDEDGDAMQIALAVVCAFLLGFASGMALYGML